MQNGVKQGGVLSATFFCIYMNNVISGLERSSIGLAMNIAVKYIICWWSAVAMP